jgi:hypothetical protein
LAIDPDSADGHYQRALALGDLGRAGEAAEAEASYLRFRQATEIDLLLRQKFRRLFPLRADESLPVHTHAVR